MKQFSTQTTDFEKHKADIIQFFDGREVNNNYVEVDSSRAKGFIFFYKENEDAYFLHFHLTLHEDVTFVLDYSNASHFERIAAFFNNNSYIVNDGEEDYKIQTDGFYTCDKNIKVRGKALKGEVLQHISFFYNASIFDIYKDEQYRTFYKLQSNFVIYLDNRTELKEFKKRLNQYMEYPQDVYHEILKIKFKELKYIFLGRLRQLDIDNLERKENSMTNYQLKVLFEIRKEILSDLRVRPNVAEFVSKYGINKMSLQKLFQETFGNTIYNYFKVERMEKTKEALIDKKMTTTEIAFEFGFSDVQHFSKQFKATFGETPSNFIKQYQTEK